MPDYETRRDKAYSAQRERIRLFRESVPAVAAALFPDASPGYELEPYTEEYGGPPRLVRATLTDGEQRFYLHYDSDTHPGRVTCGPSFPRSKRSGHTDWRTYAPYERRGDRPSCSFAFDRFIAKPETVAGEIRRKVLEPAAFIWPLVAEHQRREAENESLADRTFDALVALGIYSDVADRVGLEKRDREKFQRGESVHLYGFAGLRIELRRQGSARVEGYVDQEDLPALVAALQKLGIGT